MPSEKKQEKISHVYIQSKDHTWVPALQLKTFDGKAKVCVPKFRTEQELMGCPRSKQQRYQDNEVVNLSDYPNNVLPMANVDANGNLEDFKDMVELPFMHEAAILYNLKLRHINERPYTRTGDIVISVNPYQWYDNLYTEEKRNYYSNRLVWEQSEEDPRAVMEPHVYEVSALSYKGLAINGEDQSILVSGESGAGKTETVKICLNHIASVQRGQGGQASGGSTHDPVVKRILQSNPLLEAFGNAKTRRNDNSSRFGKYLQLQFDKCAKTGYGTRPSNCSLIGSKCEVYLLEKNRVVSHDADERTFHIFYQLLAASNSDKTRFWSGLANTNNESFAYIGHTNTSSIEGVSDGDAFRRTVEALELVGITNDKLDTLMRTICIVMQLGNLRFKEHKHDSDKSSVASKAELKSLASLMDVSENDLKLAFTERTFTTPEDTHKVPLNAEMAKDACDALAKECYLKTFLWLVEAINKATCGDKGIEHLGTIGMLDIFGFETFEVNRFEQLCINYANEKLQQKFNEDIFANVQAEYEAEGIGLEDVWYDDNTEVLDLIEGRTGLLALLNEECVRPKGNDKSFVHKALQVNKSSPALLLHRTDQLSFGIHHYAGSVMYDAEGFLSKNTDTLPSDLQSCAELCSNEIVKTPRTDSLDKPKTTGTSSVGKRKQSNIVAPTVWGKYKTQLASLMSSLRKTQSRYIRCIKPNSVKKPTLMEHDIVVDQLRCAGVVAGIMISRSVFPNRLPNSVVLARYSNMSESKSVPSRSMTGQSIEEKRAADCKALMNVALKPKETFEGGRRIKAFVVGKTKTYFRAGALEWLDSNRVRGLDLQAITIQKAARGWLARNKGKNQAQNKRMEEALEEQRRAERQAALQAAREERTRELRILKDEIARLEKQSKAKDREYEEALEKAQRRVENARAEVDTLRRSNEKEMTELYRKERAEAAAVASQDVKLEENRRIIELLKKENKRVRKERSKWQGKHNETMENSQKLEDSISNFEHSLSSVGSRTQRTATTNQDLKDKLENARDANKEMKKKVYKEQDKYMAEATVRLELQKAMGKVLTMLQDRCHNSGLVEEAVLLALQADGEAKSRMAALDAYYTSEPALIGSDVSDTDMSDNSESSYQLEA